MRYLLILAVLLFAGCVRSPAPPTEIEEQLQDFGSKNLPTDAKKVMDLGNGWKTFELETDRANRKFLYRKQDETVHGVLLTMETITEISPAPTTLE